MSLGDEHDEEGEVVGSKRLDMVVDEAGVYLVRFTLFLLCGEFTNCIDGEWRAAPCRRVDGYQTFFNKYLVHHPDQIHLPESTWYRSIFSTDHRKAKF